MNFNEFSINLFRWKGGGGGGVARMFTKLGRDEVLMACHMHKDVLAIFAQGQIQGEAK